SEPPPWEDLAAAGLLGATPPEALGWGRAQPARALPRAHRDRAHRGPGPLPALDRARRRGACRFGSGEQQRRWAAPAARGEVVLTAALAEEDGGDPRAPSGCARYWQGNPARSRSGRPSRITSGSLASSGTDRMG